MKHWTHCPRSVACGRQIYRKSAIQGSRLAVGRLFADLGFRILSLSVVAFHVHLQFGMRIRVHTLASIVVGVIVGFL